MQLIAKYSCWLFIVILSGLSVAHDIIPTIIFVVLFAITPMIILLIRDKHNRGYKQ